MKLNDIVDLSIFTERVCSLIFVAKCCVGDFLKQDYKRYVWALGSVCLVLISAKFPPLYWLALFWIVPLAVAIHDSTNRQAIILCGGCALLFWIGSIYWLLGPLFEKTEFFKPLGILIFLSVCIVQIIPYLLFGYFYVYLRCSENRWGPFWAASLLTVFWSFWPTLIPGLPEHALYRNPILIAVLDVSGVSGLLFLTTLLGIFLQKVIVARDVKSKVRFAVLATIIPCFMLTYGYVRDLQYQNKLEVSEPSDWIKVAYVQTSLIRPDTADNLFNLSELAIDKYKPDLLIWPEPSIVYSLVNRGDDRRNTFSLIKKYNQDVVVPSGYVYSKTEKRGEVRSYYNRTHLIQGGRVSGEYTKNILVPFMEYMPEPFSFLRRWMPSVSYFRAGNDNTAIKYTDKIKLAVVICYEAIFPGYVRGIVKNGGNLIINPVSDAWFKDTEGGEYHLSLAYFRALENRLPFIRVANMGISVMIAANGQLLVQPAEMGQAVVDAADVYVPTAPSLYARVGDWLSFLLVLGLIFKIVMHCKPKRLA